ncbi:hypothetical protein [Halobacteriovorax sp. HLS]|uniref:hypothetical protein n=1 Tax=Halobacteriovorax sp. HLS TaxID=2234000 RepID=UPI000FD7F91A|nr:hypothetical protein [Halobacteriovorax sp. HLS]
MATPYKRSIILINPKFQIKFSILVCLFLFISSIFYPLTVFDLVTKLVEQASANSPEMALKMTTYKNNLMVVLALFQVGFTAITFIACLLFSHKIAGPIYKVQKYLSAIRDREGNGKLYFRNGDYFTELADDFNDTFEVIQEDYKKDMVYLSEVSSYINNLSMVVPEDKKVVLDEINLKLDEIQKRYHTLY